LKHGDLVWNRVDIPGGARIIPGGMRRDMVLQILGALESRSLGLGELLRVAQYDLSGKHREKELIRVAKRIAKTLGFSSERKLLKDTSSTYMFSTEVYYTLRDLIAEKGLAFAIEPRAQSQGSEWVYDYAIIDPSNQKAVLIVEVKRLQSLNNILGYIEEFRKKKQATLGMLRSTAIGHIVLHIHATPNLAKICSGIGELLKGIALLLSETGQRALIISSMGLLDDDEDEFQEHLSEQVPRMLT